MYWRKFKSVDQLKEGDLVVVKIKKNTDVAFVGKKSIVFIPDEKKHDLKFIKENGVLFDLNKKKLGSIVKFHRLKVPK